MKPNVPPMIAARIADVLKKYYSAEKTPPHVEVGYRTAEECCFTPENVRQVAEGVERHQQGNGKKIGLHMVFSAPGETQPQDPQADGTLSRHQLAEFIWLIFLRPDLMALLQDGKDKLVEAKNTLVKDLAPRAPAPAASFGRSTIPFGRSTMDTDSILGTAEEE